MGEETAMTRALNDGSREVVMGSCTRDAIPEVLIGSQLTWAEGLVKCTAHPELVHRLLLVFTPFIVP